MLVRSDYLFSKANPQNTIGKILNFPLTRILTMILFIIPLFVLHAAITHLLGMVPEQLSEWLGYLESIVMFPLFVITYRLYARYIEKREAYEFSLNGGFKEFGSGILIGGGLLTLVSIILLASGYMTFTSINSPYVLFSGFFVFAMPAFLEELIFRLILFRLLEEIAGSWVALVLVSVLFGFAHILNPNSSVFAALAIVFEAGLLICAAFILTRRIWLIFGIHLGWNYFQSAVFGVPVSGQAFDGFLVSETSGPQWLSGGIFGIEASLITVVLGIAIGIHLLIKAINNDQLVRPRWIRNRLSSKSFL